MRTIKRRGAQYGDFRAKCGYCGVMWMRSEMVRDAAAILACPDDQAGKDLVTLARENAAGTMELRERPQRDGADRDVGGDDYATTPASIINRLDLQGWWQPKQSGTIAGGKLNWIPNVRQFSEGGGVGGRRGAVAQGDVPLQPSYTTSAVTFAGDYLESTRDDLLAAGSNPTAWMVGSFTATGGMFLLRGAISIAYSDAPLAPPVLQLGYDSTTNQLRADVTYEGNQAGDGTGTFLSVPAALPDAKLHLFRITQTTTEVQLQVDDGDVATTLTATEGSITGTGTPSAYDRVGYGLRTAISQPDLEPGFDLPHTGRLEEVVVMSSNASSSQLTAMRAYFKAQYPELP